MKRSWLISALMVLLFFYCDKGLEPALLPENNERTGVSGTLFFANWPPPDSLKDLRLIAFKGFPPELSDLLTGEAFAYPPPDSNALSFYQDRIDYQFELPAGQYRYLMVAQRFGDNLLDPRSWQAVGQYDTVPDSLPASVTVNDGEMLKNISIRVDFKQLPVQPF